MKHVNFSATEWEDRVLALLASHPDTITVVDARHLDADLRKGIDGLWRIGDGDRSVEVPFAIYVASPDQHEVRFETAILHGTKRIPGKAMSELPRLIFICSPQSHSMISIPAHALREFILQHDEYPRSTTNVGMDAKGTHLSERVLVPVEALAKMPDATVSSPESW
jgi:hypothetical protein